MDAQDSTAREWMKRVLGVAIPDTSGPVAPGTAKADAAAQWQAAAAAWRSASEAVDAQIGALQASLTTSGDAELVQIANAGLNGLTGGYKVRTLATIMELGDGAHAAPQLAKKGLAVVRDFRTHLAGSEEIAAADRNPFGVAVSIVATLGPALQQMEQSLGQLAR